MAPEPPPLEAPGSSGTILGSLLTRSTRYHRPRAPFCGVGYCTNCLVRVDGVPNVRACRTPIPPTAKVEVENAWPSARFDLLAAFDIAFPKGIDTLHGFRRPAFATPWFQRVVRRLAGTGTIPSPASAGLVRPGRAVEAKTAVIGAGAAGRACAERLVAAGDPPVLLEREPGLAPVPGAEMFSGTTAVFLPPPQDGRAHRFELIASRSDGSAISVRADRVVVAVGGYDASLWFAGSDRPGVLTAEGAERLSTPASPRFAHAVVFGGGKRALEILERFDGKVDAVVAPGTIAPELARRASELDVPLYPRTLLLGAVGRRRVEKVRLARRGGEAPPFEVEADAIVLAHRRLPHPQLFFQAGARTFWRPAVGAYGPVVGAGGATTVPGLYAAGEVAGAPEMEDARRSGGAVADALVGAVPWSAPVAAGPSEAHHELEGYYQELLSVGPGPGKVVVCPCEDVLLPELLDATDRGYRGIEVIKRYTGVGTGLCQGRYCL
ncbi:MAG: 2Fe-2S iron-sulfur cluster-binding protein, partial [Thermoplasmata archaeon]|nr:2Fe-2S iron-sulfur cluster-binding protein [Thermoplasmata archaeon]